MNRIEWIPGSHHLIVLDGLAVLLADEVPQDQVVGMWDALQDVGTVDGLGGLLDILRAVTGRGLGSLPGFAMSVTDERGLHVAARGSFNVYVTTADGEHVVRGDEASVWVERNFDVATAVDVLLATADRDGTWLPVVGGVLQAGAVRQTLLEHAPAPVETPPAEPIPAPAVETWVEPEVDEPEPAEVVETPDAPAGVDAPDEAHEPEPVMEEAPQPAQGRFASLLSPHTVMHDVEEAAVRPDDDGEPDDPAVGRAPRWGTGAGADPRARTARAARRGRAAAQCAGRPVAQLHLRRPQQVVVRLDAIPGTARSSRSGGGGRRRRSGAPRRTHDVRGPRQHRARCLPLGRSTGRRCRLSAGRDMPIRPRQPDAPHGVPRLRPAAHGRERPVRSARARVAPHLRR